MQIKQLTLKNFRCFEKINIDFHDNMTLLVGLNGAGKTAILDAIAQYLQSFIRYNDKFQLDESDLFNNAKKKSIEIHMENKFSDGNKNDKFNIKLDEKNFFDGKFVAYYNDLLNFKKTYDRQKKEEKTLKKKMVFVYYTLSRMPVKNNCIKQKETVNNDEYIEFSPTTDFQDTLKWFDTHDANEARIQRDKDKNYIDIELKLVREAICGAFPDEKFEYPHISGDPAKLYLREKETNKKFALSQISDGYKTMLALTMDLARKIVAAQKGQLDNDEVTSLNAPGIVLIDELELHLHPSWQQSVATTLQKTFPNIQFICTTHSPQIVTSVKPEQVRIIADNAGQPTTSTYGANVAHVLEDIFGVALRPPNVENLIKEYYDLINSGKGESDKGINLKNQLLDIMPNDPLIAQTNRMIYLEKFKKERRLSNA